MKTFFASFILVTTKLTFVATQFQDEDYHFATGSDTRFHDADYYLADAGDVGTMKFRDEDYYVANAGEVSNQWMPKEDFPNGGSYEWHFETYVPDAKPQDKKMRTDYEHNVGGSSSFYSKKAESYYVPPKAENRELPHQPYKEENTKYEMKTQISMSEYESEEEPEEVDVVTNLSQREEFLEFPSTTTTTMKTTTTTKGAIKPIITRQPIKRLPSSTNASIKKVSLKANRESTGKLASSTKKETINKVLTVTKKTPTRNSILPFKSRSATTTTIKPRSSKPTARQTKNKLTALVQRRHRIRTTTKTPNHVTTITPNHVSTITPNHIVSVTPKRSPVTKARLLPQFRSLDDELTENIEEQELIPSKPPSGDFGARIKKSHQLRRRQISSPLESPDGPNDSNPKKRLCTEIAAVDETRPKTFQNSLRQMLCRSQFVTEPQKQFAASNLIDDRQGTSEVPTMSDFHTNLFGGQSLSHKSIPNANTVNRNDAGTFLIFEPFQEFPFQEFRQSKREAVLYRGDVIDHFLSKYSLV